MGIQVTFIHHKLQFKQKSELIIFNKTKYTVIGQAQSNTLSLFTNLENPKVDYVLSNYRIGSALKQQTNHPIPALLQINNKKLVVIDSLALYNFKTIAPEYILLTQSPRLNLNRLIDSIQPKVIISDGSNYTSYEKRWEETCLKRKLPFHQTRKKGAYIIKL
jgi:competence protein ComEC